MAYNNYGQCYSGQCDFPTLTNIQPSLCFQTSQNSNNVPHLLNNYEGNSCCEIQVPSTNITPCEYSNSNVNSQVIYPQYEYSSCIRKEYNDCNQISSETTPVTEGFYNHGPKYSQNVTSENQIYYSPNEPTCSINQQIPVNDNSLKSKSPSELGNKKDKIRTRQIYSKQQTRILEEEFQKNPYISKAQRAQLSKHLYLSETKIKTWFQNRRTKIKKIWNFQQP
ncbi:PREDICTED: homeobox protein Dlx2a-like [Polistes dominula]|uniref:Homeobox protein Dlx2a-like n=1 Tax=Polistes dominula TaxID=743375 RepID=A0ABM1I3J1_POLDO|nr:PREDICTED: homeobox protein Dlx2a-like [Polistes dominula]